MSKEQCRELVRQIFGDEAANDDNIVQWYFDVNQVAMDDHAKSEMEAFVKWHSQAGYKYNTGSEDYFKFNKVTKNYDFFTFSDLYELYKQSKQ